MAKSRKITEEARSNLNFGVFKDKETDWVFKRTLEFMGEKAAEIGECLSTARKIDEKSSDSWVREWAKTAEMVEKNGDESLKNGHKISARECFLRASNYYRTAEYGALPSEPEFQKNWQKSRECFLKAAKLFKRPIKSIEVIFEGKKLPGYYWRADDSKTRPTLVAAGGGDSSGEEVVMWAGGAAVSRGYNFFMFEHPGHRGAVHLYPDCIRRYDMEVPYKVGLDFLQTLPGVDERIALTGYSGGGYIVTRVAAFDKRVKAVVPNSPLINPGELVYGNWPKFLNLIPLSWMDKMLEMKFFSSPLLKSRWKFNEWANGDSGLNFAQKLTKHAGILQKGETTLDGLMRWQEKMVVSDEMLKNITCPALGLVGEDEGEMMVRQAKRFIEKISSQNKVLHIFNLKKDGSNDHCQLDNRSRGNQIMFDWLDEVFNYHP